MPRISFPIYVRKSAIQRQSVNKVNISNNRQPRSDSFHRPLEMVYLRIFEPFNLVTKESKNGLLKGKKLSRKVKDLEGFLLHYADNWNATTRIYNRAGHG